MATQEEIIAAGKSALGLGNALANPWASAAGGLLQGGSQMLSQLGAARGIRKYDNTMQAGSKANDLMAQQANATQQGLFQPYAAEGQMGMQGLNSFRQEGPGQYGGVGNVQSFLDPSINYQQQQVQNQIQGAAGPVGLSGSALKQLAKQTQGIASTGWNTAVGQQMAADQNAYSQFGNNFAMKRQANQDNMDKFLKQIGLGQFGVQGQSTSAQGMNDILSQNQQMRTQSSAARRSSDASLGANMWGSALGGFGQILGGVK